MKKSFICILVVLFIASCAPQQPQQPSLDIEYEFLSELDQQEKLKAEEKAENQKIVEEYEKKKKILTQIEIEDRIEQKQLIKKQEDIAMKSEELKKEIEEKIGLQSAQIIEKNEKVKELLALDLSAEELEKRLAEETDLTDEDKDIVVKTYKVQKMIASAQTKEELEEILKEQTELNSEEIQRIVAIKQQLIDKEVELRKETLRKIHERLLRNRRLNIESVFCARTSKLDQLLLSPVYYPFDVHVVGNKYSKNLYADFEMIIDELSNYPDMMLQLEGNCDYKGSNKYNKALGDRRWSGVKPLITSLGYEESKIRGISKGEECPTPKSDIFDDETWRAENRRTDFVWVLQD